MPRHESKLPGWALKQTVVVENKPGGSAIIGTEYVTIPLPMVIPA